MVTARELKANDLESLEEFFEMIIESRINGQISQAKEEFKMLSKEQKNQFKEWYLVAFYYDALGNEEGLEENLYNLLNLLNR